MPATGTAVEHRRDCLAVADKRAAPHRRSSRRCAAKPSASIARSTAVRKAGIDPALRVARHSADRPPAARPAPCPASRRALASASSCGHGASGLTWSGVTGETPPQSLMPARDQSARDRRGQVGRRLDVHRRGRRAMRATAMVHRCSSASRLRRLRHARAGLGAEILDDDFLDVAVARRAARASPAAPRCARARVSPMPIRMPVVNGTAARPARRDGRQPHRRVACRASRNAGRRARTAARDDALQHDALRHRHRAQRRDLVARHHAGIDVRQQPGLARTPARAMAAR